MIRKSELPPDGNAHTARFVLAIKSTEEGQVRLKARYEIGGHRNKLKQYIVHGAPPLQASSVRLLLALASAPEFGIWSSDA